MTSVRIRSFTAALALWMAGPLVAAPDVPDAPDGQNPAPARQRRGARQEQPPKPTLVLPAGAIVDRDVTYGKGGDVDLKMDIYQPATKENAKPAPAAVYVHGGGWTSGNKSSGGWFDDVTVELLSRGYVVIGVDYRLGPNYKWPAYINDCKCAIRFLRANAQKYHIDPNRIGTWGGSAGGHLVQLLGLADASAKLEGDGGSPDQSSHVQAVVDFFGPSDFTESEKSGGLIEQLFGDHEARKQASPVTYISKGAPPFLIIQGENDKLVNPEQSKKLYERLQAAGVPATLIMVKNGGHGTMGKKIEPTREEIIKKVVEFFDEHLRSK